MDSAYEWKRFYAAERQALGERELLRLVDETPAAPLARDGALVVPHTRLQVTGAQIAAAANAVVDSGADRVLALGVLHGGSRREAALVASAKAGEPSAVAELRRVHDEDGHAAEEFSLDGLTMMIALAAGRAGRTVEVIRRYPFLAGVEPESLPGVDELAALVADGCLLVATTDPMHHGHGYGDAPEQCRAVDVPSTLRSTSAAIGAQLESLSRHEFARFQELAAADRSDFRDTGPVLAMLLGSGFTWSIEDLALVDYSDTLNAPAPTWVAGALVTTNRA